MTETKTLSQLLEVLTKREVIALIQSRLDAGTIQRARERIGKGTDLMGVDRAFVLAFVEEMRRMGSMGTIQRARERIGKGTVMGVDRAFVLAFVEEMRRLGSMMSVNEWSLARLADIWLEDYLAICEFLKFEDRP